MTGAIKIQSINKKNKLFQYVYIFKVSWLLICNLFPFLCAVSENHSKGSGKEFPEDEDSPHCANSVFKFVSLRIGDEFSGVVSHIKNPDTFFCQQMQNARKCWVGNGMWNA